MKSIPAVLLLSLFSFSNSFAQSGTNPDSLFIKNIIRGNYDSALFIAEEAAAIILGTAGEKNVQYGSKLHDLSTIHFYLGNYSKSRYYIIKEIELREKLKLNQGLHYYNALVASSVICRRAGYYEEALAQIKKAEREIQKLYKQDSREYADFLESYAGVNIDMGSANNDRAYLDPGQKHLKKAESIYLKYGDETVKQLIINKTDQAAYFNNIGATPKAEYLLQEAIQLCRDKYGLSSKEYASALNNLAVLYFNVGNYKLAEKLLNEALIIYNKFDFTKSMPKGICITNLGALYHAMGNYKIAEKLTGDAKQIFESSNQQGHLLFVVVLNNQASVAISAEYYASPDKKSPDRIYSSGKNLMMADSLFRINCNFPHPFNLSVRVNQLSWHNLSGEKKSKKLLADMALEGNARVTYLTGHKVDVLATLMNKMSVSAQLPSASGLDQFPYPVIIPISLNIGQEEEMVSALESIPKQGTEYDALTTMILRQFLGNATDIKKAVGPYHPAYDAMVKQLSIVYAYFDDFKSEEELKLEHMNVINQKTLRDFSYLAESEKEMYFESRLSDIHAFTSYSLARKQTNPKITRHAYNNILLNKGLMLKSSTAMRLAILNSGNPALLRQYDEWIALQKEISVLYSTPVEFRTRDVSGLEESATALERSLVASSQDFSTYRNEVQLKWEDVRKSLKPDEAAIEFTDFRKLEKNGGDEVLYCALIVRSNSEYPEMIKLFSESQLEAVIGTGGLNSINDINNAYGSSKNKNDALYNLIWKPIEAYLNEIKNVYISPSGLLHKISFPAISNGKDVYLCDNYRIQVKGSTGNIAEKNLFSQANTPSALILGGIQYSEASSGSDVWGYLKGTKDEGDVINGIFEKAQINVKYLSGNTATETFLKENAGNYNILHLATHGFFFDDPNKVRFEEKKQNVEYGQIAFRGAVGGYAVNSFVNSENPLMRSGLVLAGANDVWVKTEKGDADDGVLTAQEVTQIDMRKNDLVVLSACETGLGDIKGSEGVYGLQRALKMAGVKYIIMSLWQIPDKETVEFMGAFYKNLLSLKDIHGAFSEAQKTMRAKYDPYYWGAFVLME